VLWTTNPGILNKFEFNYMIIFLITGSRDIGKNWYITKEDLEAFLDGRQIR